MVVLHCPTSFWESSSGSPSQPVGQVTKDQSSCSHLESSCADLRCQRQTIEEWSGRPGSNRRHPAWEAGVLPLNYSRSLGRKIVKRLTHYSRYKDRRYKLSSYGNSFARNVKLTRSRTLAAKGLGGEILDHLLVTWTVCRISFPPDWVEGARMNSRPTTEHSSGFSRARC